MAEPQSEEPTAEQAAPSAGPGGGDDPYAWVRRELCIHRKLDEGGTLLSDFGRMCVGVYQLRSPLAGAGSHHTVAVKWIENDHPRQNGPCRLAQLRREPQHSLLALIRPVAHAAR